jgi:glutamyl-tRNA synthetase
MRSAADSRALGEQPFAWRFRVPSGAVTWQDLVRGEISIDPSRRGGDFLVARSGGVFSYQLAVVVDDAAMGVTQVIRGDDLVESTPRQLLLYRALGLEPPRFGHVPLVVGPDGSRLAKREDSCRIETLRERGVDAATLVDELLGSLRYGVRVGGSEREENSTSARFCMEPTGRDRWNSDRMLLEINK